MGLVDLLKNSMAPSSWTTYQRALRSFADFGYQYKMHIKLPAEPITVALYLAHLRARGYAPSTMATHVSAIGFIHKLLDAPDPTRNFLIQKALEGAKRKRSTFDTRLPITHPILLRLVDSLERLGLSLWDRVMFRSMYLLAFFACLRIGELALPSKAAPNHTLNISSVKCTGREKLEVRFATYKHSKKPATISVYSQPRPAYCPVAAWLEYLKVRGEGPGYLYVNSSRQPVTRQQFTRQLSLSLKSCQLSSTLYKSHSFRIGAASHAAAKGYSNTQIRELGRWNSDAFPRCIRF